MADTVILSARPQNFITIWVMFAIGLAIFFGVGQLVRRAGGSNGN